MTQNQMNSDDIRALVEAADTVDNWGKQWRVYEKAHLVAALMRRFGQMQSEAEAVRVATLAAGEKAKADAAKEVDAIRKQGDAARKDVDAARAEAAAARKEVDAAKEEARAIIDRAKEKAKEIDAATAARVAAAEDAVGVQRQAEAKAKAAADFAATEAKAAERERDRILGELNALKAKLGAVA